MMTVAEWLAEQKREAREQARKAGQEFRFYTYERHAGQAEAYEAAHAYAVARPEIGSAGVVAEPVAWAWEAEKFEGGRLLRVGLNLPEERPGVRNIRPLYEHPPVAAPTPPAGCGETVAGADYSDALELAAKSLAPKPSPASSAGDLNSLSARLHKLAHALWSDSDCRTDWSVEAMEIWKGLVALAPAAPRKGPSASDLIQAIHENVSSVTGAGGVTWVDYTQVQEVITALLTPADRGETQAVSDEDIEWLAREAIRTGDRTLARIATALKVGRL